MDIYSELYHCTHHRLNKGDIIEPGNWGKKLFEHGIKHISWRREIVLEAIRLESYPTKPSRLNSTFSCTSLETLKCYKSKHNPDGNIYKVNFVDPNLSCHKGDFNAVEPLPRLSHNMLNIAMEYWKYGIVTSVQEWPGIECSEIVSNSPLVVIEV